MLHLRKTERSRRWATDSRQPCCDIGGRGCEARAERSSVICRWHYHVSQGLLCDALDDELGQVHPRQRDTHSEVPWLKAAPHHACTTRLLHNRHNVDRQQRGIQWLCMPSP